MVRGGFTCFLSKHGKIKGFDFTEKSVVLARQLAKHLGKDISFEVDDITQKRHRGKFDYIFSIGVLHSIPEVDKALENIKMMMNKDSLFIVSVYNLYSNFYKSFKARKLKKGENISRYMDDYEHPYEILYKRNEFKRLLESHGFEVVGEWRKIPSIIRLLTGKGKMMTFCTKLKDL